MRSVVINGRFLSASPAGVQRVAEELTIALDSILAGEERPALTVEVIAPKNMRRRPVLKTFRLVAAGHLTRQLWEQVELPWLSRGRLLLNLCNLGPLAKREAITMIHDAQVYSSPRSYSAAFRLGYRALQPLIGRRHARILTVSEFSKRELVRYGVAPAGKITVIHNGVDHVLCAVSNPSSLSRFGLRERSYVLGLSNTQSHKNIKLMLEAFAAPDMAALTLVLFGSATREDFVREGLSIPRNVLFTGKIGDDVLRGLMEGAACLVFPSLTEGFGLPPMEAMLLGCPVVVAPSGALPEVCGEGALYAGTHSAAEWRRVILQLHRDPAFARTRSEIGRRHAATFTWARAARALLQTLEAPL